MSVTDFTCSLCSFSKNADYYGNKPPFAPDYVLLEEAFVMKDPFTANKSCIILGSKCSLCSLVVCVSQDCSLYYTKRFCLPCVNKSIEEFPKEIKLEIQKRSHASLKR